MSTDAVRQIRLSISRSPPSTRFVSSSTRSGGRRTGCPGRAPPSRRAAPDTGDVLLGEHLGRRHQRTLVAALHRRQQRRHGDDRLAGADVALQQPVHRVRPGEVGADLVDRPAAARRSAGTAAPRGSGRRVHRRPCGGCPRESVPVRLRITSTICTRRSSSNASRRRACSFSASSPAGGSPRAPLPIDQPEAASTSTAPGRRCRGPGTAQRVLHPAGDLPRGICAFSLCG